MQVRAFNYDGDGVLRSAAHTLDTDWHYVTPDYQVDLSTGKVYVYYRFGGRVVAWREGSTFRYLLADHLGSTHGEVDQAQTDLAQRRYYPYGSDRSVSGASDLARDERFTGQPRVDAGGGNSRCELYSFGARWYLPGVGVFTQPDSTVPEPMNPQTLNRYSYTANNPVNRVDPTGQTIVYVGGMGENSSSEDSWATFQQWAQVTLGEQADPAYYFTWPQPSLPWESTMQVSIDQGVAQLTAFLGGQNPTGKPLTDVILVGHSKGGALITEYGARLASGDIQANYQLRGIFILDAPLSGPMAQGASLETPSLLGISPNVFRFANMEQRLRNRGMNTHVAGICNNADFVCNSSVPPAGMSWYSFWATAGSGVDFFGSTHGMVMSDPNWVFYVQMAMRVELGNPEPAYNHAPSGSSGSGGGGGGGFQ